MVTKMPRSCACLLLFSLALPSIAAASPPYSEDEVRTILEAATPSLRQCVGIDDVPTLIRLDVEVRTDGRFALTSAELPAHAAPGASSCLAARVSSMRARGRPERKVAYLFAFQTEHRGW